MRRILTLLILFAAAGCGEQQQTIDVRFVAMRDGVPATCADDGSGMSDLRFYVSAPTIPATGLWQTDGVALIDLEDGQGSCINGTVDMNDTVSLEVPVGNLKALRLTIGVPFELNHENPLTAKSPLNDSAMHWHWRSGYKFLRAGVMTEDGEAWIHLGSTGCEGTVGNISGCGSPNRVIVDLSAFDPATDRIAVNLSALLDAKAMLEAGDRLDCSSGPAEASCSQPFAAMGLRFGDADTPGPQRVFTVLQ